MYKKTAPLFLALLISFICFSIANLQATNEQQDDSVNPKVQKKKPRSYTTSRLTGTKPVIDGKLDDSCWQSGVWAGDYTQWTPKEGGRPSQPTEIKVLYDDKNMYVAIKAYDSEPSKIQCKAGRRDEFEGDIVGICFDSYHDHRTGFEFDVTAAGQKIDAIITNPMNMDSNWNPVWYVKVSKDDKGWYAEMEIPLSQLRYSANDVQVWGMHSWRWINRLEEESDWEVQSSTGPGLLYLFGELHGINSLKKSKRIEIMPYTVGKFNTFKKEPGNPYTEKGSKWNGTAGLDAKIGVSSNFTIDLTVNPDFGQVEADPSVMNLSAFETFFEEKRPFFLEGKNIFNYDLDDASIFYSRRIGQSNGFIPLIQSDEYLKMPENTTIYTAEKFSGKTANGLTVGVIQSLTAGEMAHIHSSTGEREEEVEPLTSYTVGRVQQDFHEGNTVIGGIITSTNRITSNSNFNNLNRGAYTGGLDLLHQWYDKEFFIDFKLMGSNINGNPEAIAILQNSSPHYYQRPDAHYLHYDPTRTSLDGYGGKFKIGKGSKGLWKYSTEFNWRSPGLDLNDIGFMQMADYIKQANSVSYSINKPVSIFRTYYISLYQSNTWNFGREYLGSGGSIYFYSQFTNQWAVNTTVGYSSQSLDTHILRGGPAMIMPANWNGNLNFNTNMTMMASLNLGSNYIKSYNNNYTYNSIYSTITFRPINTLKFSMNVTYSTNSDHLQYVTTQTFNNHNNYIFAKIDQKSLGLTFRIDYNLNPELSVQFYGSPFSSIGKYSIFKNITASRAGNYNDRFKNFNNPVLLNNAYQLDINDDLITDFSLSNPDFSFIQFRSNFVVRWEYRPGSSFYFVWSNEQTEYENNSNNSIGDSFSKLKNAFSNNLFLIKWNYWFSI